MNIFLWYVTIIMLRCSELLTAVHISVYIGRTYGATDNSRSEYVLLVVLCNISTIPIQWISNVAFGDYPFWSLL